MTVSIGGEIGEVGKSNSTEAELRAYLDTYRNELAAMGDDDMAQISKVSIQTGTSHGGVPLPDGSIAQVKIDFDTMRRLSTVARERVRARRLRPARRVDAARGGVRPLPGQRDSGDPPRDRLPEHPLRRRRAAGRPPRRDDGLVRGELRRRAQGGETEEQFLYKTRKKAIGPFKRRLWELPAAAQDAIGGHLGAKFGQLFDALQIAGTRALVERFVTPVALPRPLPAALGGGAAAGVTAGASVFEDDGSGE